MNERMLTFDRDVSAESVSDLLLQLQRPSTPRLVMVDSDGGTFEFFSALGPAVRRCGITTLAGDVASSALVLYLLGHRRQALPDSTFYFHEVRAIIGPYGEITVTDMADYLGLVNDMSLHGGEVLEHFLEQMQSAQRWMVSYLSDLTGVPAGTFLTLMRDEVTLTAREARHYNIVHEIISSPY